MDQIAPTTTTTTTTTSAYPQLPEPLRASSSSPSSSGSEGEGEEGERSQGHIQRQFQKELASMRSASPTFNEPPHSPECLEQHGAYHGRGRIFCWGSPTIKAFPSHSTASATATPRRTNSLYNAAG